MPPAGALDLSPYAPSIPPIPQIDVHVDVPPIPQVMAIMKDYAGQASCFGDGDVYAIVGDPGTRPQFCGNTGGEMEAEVEKARSVAHGHFLLFRHDGKYYVVDDPATVLAIETMDQKLRDQGEQMRDLGKKFREEGQQIRDEAQKEREAGQKLRD